MYLKDVLQPEKDRLLTFTAAAFKVAVDLGEQVDAGVSNRRWRETASRHTESLGVNPSDIKKELTLVVSGGYCL